MTLTRATLAAAASDRAAVTERDAELVTDQLIREIVRELGAGASVKIHEFAVFEVDHIPARNGARNPKRPLDGTITVPAHDRIRFRPSIKLLQLMNPGRKFSKQRVRKARQRP